MPRINQPESDEGRLFILNKAITLGPADRAKQRNYLSGELIASILTFVNDQSDPLTAGYASCIAGVTTARAKLRKETGEAQTGWEFAEQNLRDFWEVLKRRCKRPGFSLAALAFYKLSADSWLPTINNREDIETLCNQVIDGDAEAVKAGHPAMVNPSAQEVAKALADAKKEADDVLEPSRSLDAAQRALQAKRPRAIELVDDVIAELRFNLRHMEPGAARDIMRSYGVAFTYEAGEAKDAADVPAPAPVPPPA